MADPLYRCAACGMAVIVLGGRIVRGCKHDDAAVVGSMTATVKAHGGLRQSTEDDEHAGAERS